MSIITVPITCTFNDQNGNPIAGARVTAKLNKIEIYQGMLVSDTATAVADVNGVAVLNVWPNALGTQGSLYAITAISPASGGKFMDAMVSVPNSACNLHQILNITPYPVIDAAQQALAGAQGALALVTEQIDIATTKAVEASTSATSASEAATAATAASSSASGSATTATTQAGIATTKAAEASASAAAALAAVSSQVTAVTGAAPIASTGGLTPVISIAAATTSAPGSMSATDKTKLDGVAAWATAYTHPANHPASIIAQDASNRFVTDDEKTAWNAKQPAGTYATGGGTATGTNTGDQVLPTTLPASDVYPWAKEATKPAYTASEVGLGNVDNTSDATKNAATATLTNKTLTSPDINGGTVDGAVIGGAVPAAGSFTTLSATGSATVGNGSGNNAVLVNSTASGTGGGGAAIVQNGGTSIIAIGNKSSLLGGAYNATPMLYGNGATIEVNTGLSVTGGISATGAVGGNNTQALSVTDSTNGLTMSLLRTGATYAYAGVGALESWVYSQGSSNLCLGPDGAGSVKIVTNGAERARFDASGNLGLGVVPSAWGASYKVFQTPAGGIGAFSTSSVVYSQNAYDNGGWKYLNTGAAGYYNQSAGIHSWGVAPSGTAGQPISFTTAMTLDASGNLIQTVNTAAPTLAANKTLAFELTNDTTLKIKVRGSDGVTRSTTFTLA